MGTVGPLSLLLLAALEQRCEGLRLTDLARVADSSLSSVQTAVMSLTADGFVERRGHRHLLTTLGRRAAESLLDLAVQRVPARILAAALRASAAVEFSSIDPQGLVIVLRWDTEPADEVLLDRMLARSPVPVTRLGHDEVRDELLDSRDLAERVGRASVLVGSLERSFPDRRRHGDPEAPLLGQLHPAVRRPSQRGLSELARRYGLSEIRVFGSAVHADFRRDSDVDVMVRRRPGVARTLSRELGLRSELESLIGRDVDVADAQVMREPVRRRAESEGVVLYGRS